MTLLLDTNVFLWWVEDSSRLGAGARGAIVTNDVVVSAATGWEIATKRGLGRLRFDGDIVDHVGRNGFRTLDISLVHAVEAGALPFHHRDPFDRILIAQARLENLIVMTSDSVFGRYEVPLLPV